MQSNRVRIDWDRLGEKYIQCSTLCTFSKEIKIPLKKMVGTRFMLEVQRIKILCIYRFFEITKSMCIYLPTEAFWYFDYEFIFVNNFGIWAIHSFVSSFFFETRIFTCEMYMNPSVIYATTKKGLKYLESNTNNSCTNTSKCKWTMKSIFHVEIWQIYIDEIIVDRMQNEKIKWFNTSWQAAVLCKWQKQIASSRNTDDFRLNCEAY